MDSLKKHQSIICGDDSHVRVKLSHTTTIGNLKEGVSIPLLLNYTLMI